MGCKAHLEESSGEYLEYLPCVGKSTHICTALFNEASFLIRL
jgi:hypothetical protein